MYKMPIIALLSALSVLAAAFLGGFANHPAGMGPGNGAWRATQLAAVVTEDPLWTWLRQAPSHVAALPQTVHAIQERVQTTQYTCGMRTRYLRFGSYALGQGAPGAAQDAFHIAGQFSKSCWRELRRLDQAFTYVY
jgi:hypothetical protein